MEKNVIMKSELRQRKRWHKSSVISNSTCRNDNRHRSVISWYENITTFKSKFNCINGHAAARCPYTAQPTPQTIPKHVSLMQIRISFGGCFRAFFISCTFIFFCCFVLKGGENLIQHPWRKRVRVPITGWLGQTASRQSCEVGALSFRKFCSQGSAGSDPREAPSNYYTEQRRVSCK